MMTPRWARKLYAEARPAPTIHGEYLVLKPVLAATVLCFPAGAVLAWGISWLIPNSAPSSVSIVVALASLFVLAPLVLVWIRRGLGAAPMARSVLPVLTFFGVVCAVLLMEIAR